MAPNSPMQQVVGRTTQAWQHIWRSFFGEFLVGGLEHFLFFHIYIYIGNNHPNWLSYFSEGLKPPTSFVWDCLNNGGLRPCDNDCISQEVCGDIQVFVANSGYSSWKIVLVYNIKFLTPQKWPFASPSPTNLTQPTKKGVCLTIGYR